VARLAKRPVDLQAVRGRHGPGAQVGQHLVAQQILDHGAAQREVVDLGQVLLLV
jgi:hypothetical protein